MKITTQEKETIRLLMRTEDRGEGWRQCATKIYENLFSVMPDELVEKDAELLRVRLTPAGEAVAKWAC
jgi:hypothetical protein